MVDRADERTKFITCVQRDVHMTGITSPTLGCAHDVYDSLLASLRSSLTPDPRKRAHSSDQLQCQTCRRPTRTPQVRMRPRQIRRRRTLGGRQYSGISSFVRPLGDVWLLSPGPRWANRQVPNMALYPP
jgi:hypothetical protein